MVPFYLNYFFLVPNILRRVNFYRFLLWFISYTITHFVITYPLYEYFPNYFQLPGIVDDGKNIGAIIHISFYYLSFSTAGRFVLDWVQNTKTNHRLYLKKADKEIEALKSEMSFPFVKGVLEELEKEAILEPSNVVKPISSLAKVLRFKLYRKKEENIMLSDEVKIIENYLQLLSAYHNSKWILHIRHDQWIETGSAFLLVEQFINSSTYQGGVLELFFEDEEIKIELKE